MYEKLKDEQYRNLGGINVKISEYNTQETQFLDLRNFTFVRPGALQSRPGQGYHATFSRSTFITQPKNLVEFQKTTGESYTIFDSGANLYTLQGPSLIYPSLTSSYTLASQIDFESVNNKLYFFNGTYAGVFLGDATYDYKMPAFVTYVSGAGVTFNTSLPGPSSVIPSGTFFAGFLYARGTTGALDLTESATNLAFQITEFFNKYPDPNSATINPRFLVYSTGSTISSTGRWVLYGFTLPTYSGVSVLIPALVRQAGGLTLNLFQNPVGFYLTTSAGVTMFHMEFDHLTASQFDGFITQTFNERISIVESFNNFLFFAGDYNNPSTVYYSNLGEPQGSEPENFFQVKSVNGDIITCLYEFQDSLIIFKNNSFYELRGASPEVFQVRELSVEYGCLNNFGVAQFENKLWFVDKKGIVEFNGANVKLVSEPIESYLDQVDKSKIRAFHLKGKNQVWFCAEGKCFVYDYFVEAWTIFDDIECDTDTGAAILSYGATTQDVSYFIQGASFQSLARFNDSLNTDFGQDITLIAKTRFHKRLKESTQELWRRLYVNADVGATQSVTLNFYSNYSQTASLVSSVVVSQFQERIDFGVSAKSLSVEFIIRASQSIRVNGYTLESRYLRSV